MNMTIGFDLDGTLEHPALAALCKALLNDKHVVHIISGSFPEAKWQNKMAKMDKLEMLGIPFCLAEDEVQTEGDAILHVIDGLDGKKHTPETRRIDIGMRKGALCFELGIEIYIDNSADYCKLIPSMNRAVAVLQVH
jgi:hypothetical protein